MAVNIIDFIVLLALLFLAYYIFIHFSTEKLQNIQKTVLGTTNPFTGLFCVNDEMPIVRSVEAPEGGKTLQCISRNGNDCMTRKDLTAPDFFTGTDGKDSKNQDIITHSPLVCDLDLNMTPCKDAFQKIDKPFTYVNRRGNTTNNKCVQFNKYITQDAIRNPKEPPNSIFRELDSNQNPNHKYFTCTQAGLKDPEHWCGKVYNTLKDTVCKKRDILQGPLFTSVCKDVDTFSKTESANTEPVTVNTNEEIKFLKTVDKCKKRFCTVNKPKDITMEQCLQNCDICADTKCN
jgi:hypothetical protein